MSEDVTRERSLAYALARIGLGINIALHGLTRLPHLGAFAAGLVPEFSHTFLPGPLVEATGYLIVVGEALIGLLVLFGLWLRPALVAGLLLMLLLQFGTCLRQEWNTAGLQLPYLGYYAALIATVRYDRWSVDSARGAGRAELPRAIGT